MQCLLELHIFFFESNVPADLKQDAIDVKKEPHDVKIRPLDVATR